MDPAQLKEHTLNRIGYGYSYSMVWEYDTHGFSGLIDRQLNGPLSTLIDLGTFIVDKISRPVSTSRQLEAVLIDFWYNHFNINAGSDIPEVRDNRAAGRYINQFQNDAIVPFVLGDFKDMLIATAKSVSMLDYLDNRFNYTPSPSGSLNENYAREVMELHTIGVDASYTDADVADAARILTGWSVSLVQPRTFQFKPNRHDDTEKEVMNVVYPAGRGLAEGEEFLEFLADYPTTALFLADKLCRRFVSETPSAAIVAAAADAYSGTRDLKAVMTAIFSHPDFVADENFRSKVKSPHRFVASALMSLGVGSEAGFADIADELVAGIIRAGERPYLYPAPNGVPEVSAYWVSTSSMLARFEIASLIAYDPVIRNFAKIRTQDDGNDIGATVTALAAIIVPGGVSATTFNAAAQHATDNATTPDERISAAIQMLLSSPEFLRY